MDSAAEQWYHMGESFDYLCTIETGIQAQARKYHCLKANDVTHSCIYGLNNQIHGLNKCVQLS